MGNILEPYIDSYYSIQSPSKGIYKDKGSKFYSFAFPVEDEQQVKEIVASLKRDYFDARHHCYAYRLGLKGDVFRMNDDGEPSSTAGKPILGQIISNDLSDILVVVVRYFGGILLGTSGLIAAYKGAAADALANATRQEKVSAESYTIEFDYIQMNGVMKILKDLKLAPKSADYGNMCRMDVDVRLSQVERFKKLFTEDYNEDINTIKIWQKV